MRPPWLATSTTTAPTWLRRRRTASGSSPLSRCPTSMNPWPRPFTRSTTSRQTASCCWPTTMAPTSVRTARTTSARHHPRRIPTGAQRHSPQICEHPVHPQPCRRLRAVCLAPDGPGNHGLLAFAKPAHVTFGSDFPYAPVAAGKLFAAGLETYRGLDTTERDAIDRTNALMLFPRLGATSAPPPVSRFDTARHIASRLAMRGVARLISTG
jgi:hypothetical protein